MNYQRPPFKNDAELGALRPEHKPYRATDAKCPGLFVWVTPRGTKSFRCKYDTDGARKTRVLGTYPAMRLSEARAARLEVRKMVQAGRDPNRERRAERARAQTADAADATTFEAVARDWHKEMAKQWKPLTATQVLLRLERHAFPKIGRLLIATIEYKTIKPFLVGIHDKAPAVAEKLRKDIGMIFDYAIREERTTAKDNPIRIGLRGLPRHNKGRNHPSVRTLEDARVVIHAVERTNLMPPVLLYHRLIALTGARESAARLAEWSQFATPGLWEIPAKHMKGKQGKERPLTLPLSRQAEELVAAARALYEETGQRGDFVFPSLMGTKLKVCAPYTLNSAMKPALRRAGIVESDGRVAHVPHGWRTTFVTVMKKRRKPGDVLQAMLGHVVHGVAGIYDQSAPELAYGDDARAIAQEWADILLEGASSAFALVGLPAPSNVVPFPQHGAAPRTVAKPQSVAEPRAASGLRRRLR